MGSPELSEVLGRRFDNAGNNNNNNNNNNDDDDDGIPLL
jgi:hypothetical protein